MSRHAVNSLADCKDLWKVEWNEETLSPELVAALQRHSSEAHSHSHKPPLCGPRYTATRYPMKVAPSPQIYDIVYTLCETLLALGCVANFDDCLNMPLEVGGGHSGYSFRVNTRSHQLHMPTVSEAWRLLTVLLCYLENDGEPWVSKASVASSKGWTLVLGTVHPVAPYRVRPHFTVHRGVPARNRERKRWVTDATITGSGEMVCWDSASGFCVTEHAAGELMHHQSRTHATFQHPRIGVTGDAFEVVHFIELKSTLASDRADAHVRTGYRELQQLCWEPIVVPPCQHGGNLTAPVPVPQACVAFSGWRNQGPPADGSYLLWNSDNGVNLALTSGSPPAQWVLLFCSRMRNKHFQLKDWEG